MATGIVMDYVRPMRISNIAREHARITDSENQVVDRDIKILRALYATKKLESYTCVSWKELTEDLVKNCKNKSLVDTNLRSIFKVATQLVGNSAENASIEKASVFLFFTFAKSDDLSKFSLTLISDLYGNVKATTSRKAYQFVKDTVSQISSTFLDELYSRMVKEIPNKSTFYTSIPYVDVRRSLCPETDLFTFLRDLQNEPKEEYNSFSMCHEETPVQEQTYRHEVTLEPYSHEWLVDQLKKTDTLGGNLDIPYGDIASSVLTLVTIYTYGHSKAELESELFDLLGVDRIPLIQTILTNKEAITKVQAAREFAISELAGVSESSNVPTYGCQVVVQSDKEKVLRKQFRKEEKKLQRSTKDNGVADTPEEFVFDSKDLRTKRKVALLSQANSSIVRPRAAAPRERYPNVYDSYSEAKQAAGSIGGTKMLLPLGFKLKNEKEYEEITIPVSEPAPVEIGKNLVPISALDHVGQTAFHGMKTLNRIQSVVFETAYRTNENLLICAPTGAGKTNIALLTMVNIIKQHIVDEVLKKDEFKIVYVAPMKALAAEMTANFSKRLTPLGIQVKELTGDMQLTKMEIMQTQVLVTTPEKWDVVTRKSTGDVALSQLVKLLIIDEVHLLHGDRGPVVETLVARTLRQVETSQRMIRIVGLSATLPNYLDVARFLHVNPYVGLFYFDGRFRPVPLGQTFIGVKGTGSPSQQNLAMDTVCFDKAVEMARHGHQVMVFVHARNATVNTAMALRDIAAQRGQGSLFEAPHGPQYGEILKTIGKSRNKQLVDLFNSGFGIHHAGMLRADRSLVEKAFGAGAITCLVCTSTLAWGVNLPAHAVIIRGTEIYDAKHGSFVDLGILDVLQIFGRAGRPQFDKSGHGTIITTHNKLSHYLSLLTNQFPIESSFIQGLGENLNAEITLGTVTDIEEGIIWLTYTYLYIRMRMNPQAYGIKYSEIQADPTLDNLRREYIVRTAQYLDKARMIRFDENTGYLAATDLGRTASHYYIKCDTVLVFLECMESFMNDGDINTMISKAHEFNQLKVRNEEMEELDYHKHSGCSLPVSGGSENTHGKVSILLQTYISRERVEAFSLVSDQNYIIQNAGRIARAFFEIVLRWSNPLLAGRMLHFSQCIEKRMWGYESPLRQFGVLGEDVLQKLETRNIHVEKLKEMDAKEIGVFISNQRMGLVVKKCAHELPMVEVDCNIQPITRTVLRVTLLVTPNFTWNDRVHGKTCESFLFWVEDPESNYLYHHEFFNISKKQVLKREPQKYVFTIPVVEPLPPQYYARVLSDRWLGVEVTFPVSFKHLILPEQHLPHTDLLNLRPLPVAALKNESFEKLYTRFTHFNAIQTQLFHCMYHTDNNVLLGAPTGSGKTIAAEIAMFRVFSKYPGTKVVYIAPLKALVRERMEDWNVRLTQLGKKVVELTGDTTPDIRAIEAADVIVTTPEKWDGISRSWQTRNYVKLVSLIVIDEIHLLGEDRGPVLEVIVSRTNFIAAHTKRVLRLVGLSTALANARDLADWLGIKRAGLYNFRPSVRPVPLEVHIQGFPGKHYCPRMATMNKPAFQAVKQHSPDKPVLVFVSSRRQTRLTALDLIAHLARESNPKQWMHMQEAEMDQIICRLHDTNLKLTLAFGIGIHHAGLQEKDRKTVEELFVNRKIQILIATATLAWGVNFPAHLVVVKGTEYYDGKTRRYVDMPITDVLQMIGRAGRPQYDDHAVAVVLVHDVKKHFYKRFLYEPFPVESSLLEVLPDHLNAEVVAGTIQSKQDAVDYLTWTYFFHRLLQNPSYYNLEDKSSDRVNIFLSNLVHTSTCVLALSGCIDIDPQEQILRSTTLGKISSYYYLSHMTMKLFHEKLGSKVSIEDLLTIMTEAQEYEQIPVRHNEDLTNTEFSKICRINLSVSTMNSPHTKTHLLLQGHFSHLTLPCSDYYTDLKSVLDQAIRIIQAMIDMSADRGWLATTLRLHLLMQMVIQGKWTDDSPLLTLPYLEQHHLSSFTKPSSKQLQPIKSLPSLMYVCSRQNNLLCKYLPSLGDSQIEQISKVLKNIPMITVSLSVKGWWSDSERKEARVVNRVRRSKEDWLPVHADQEYTLTVNITRLNRATSLRVHAPHFPKIKDECWFLVLGDSSSEELLAMKRLSGLRDKSTQHIAFRTPDRTGNVVYTLYMMSDCYIGLDQQYDVCLKLLPASIDSQINTELQLEDFIPDSLGK